MFCGLDVALFSCSRRLKIFNQKRNICNCIILTSVCLHFQKVLPEGAYSVGWCVSVPVCITHSVLSFPMLLNSSPLHHTHVFSHFALLFFFSPSLIISIHHGVYPLASLYLLCEPNPPPPQSFCGHPHIITSSFFCVNG